MNLSPITRALLIIGGLNWMLVALGYNIVQALFGQFPIIVNTIYILVGLAALYEMFHTYIVRDTRYNRA